MKEFRIAVIHIVKAKDADAAVAKIVGKETSKEITEIHYKDTETKEHGSIVIDRHDKKAGK